MRERLVAEFMKGRTTVVAYVSEKKQRELRYKGPMDLAAPPPDGQKPYGKNEIAFFRREMAATVEREYWHALFLDVVLEESPCWAEKLFREALANGVRATAAKAQGYLNELCGDSSEALKVDGYLDPVSARRFARLIDRDGTGSLCAKASDCFGRLKNGKEGNA